MTRSQKILLGVGVLIVVLFVLSVANGSRSGTGDAGSGRSGFVAWLGKLAGPPATVDRTDVTADCLQPGDRLEVKDSCTVTVAAGDGTRSLKLHAENAVTVTAPVPNDDSTADHEAKAGEDVSVTVDADGADVVLRCGSCVLTLEGGE